MQYAKMAAKQLETMHSVTILVDSWADSHNREVVEMLAKCDDKVLSLDAFCSEERQTGSIMI